MAMFWFDEEEKQKGYNAYLKNKQKNNGQSVEVNQGKKYEQNFVSKSAKKGSTSYDWEKEMLHDLPKTYGKSYNEKFTTLSKELGIEDEHDFRKYLDAKEKGALVSDQISQMLLENNEQSRVDFIKRSSGMKDDAGEEQATTQPPRTTLDRVFDPLLAFNYASAGLAMGFADNGSDDDQNPFSRAWKGIKSGNPFGEGNIQNEYSYSKVFEEMGWKPTSTAGKVAKGGLGFVGDVLLDPTTYLTLGTGAIVKGTGKVGSKGAAKLTAKEIAEETGSKYTKIKDTEKFVEASRKAHIEKLVKENPEVSKDLIEKLATKKAGETRKAIQLAKGEMTEDLAKGIVTDTIKKRGLTDVSEQQVAKDAQNLMSEYNRAKGIKQRTGITLSLANAPFGEQIFKSWADKKLTLVSGETLAKTSDKLGVSKGYKSARNAFLGSKLGGLFSTTSKLKKLADEDPSKLYDYLKFVDITKGRQLNKLADEREIQAVGKQIAGLSPAEQKELTELMQDKTVWHKISKTIKLSETLDARRIRKDLVAAQKAAQTDIDTLATNKNNLEGLQHANEKLLFDANDELEILRAEYRAKLADVDLKHVQDDAQLEEYMAMFRQETLDLQSETFKLGQRTKRANKRGEELEQMGSELVTKQADDVAKLDATKEADVQALRDETRAGRDEINAEIGVKQSEIETKQAENKKFEEEGLVDPSTYAKYFEMNEGYTAQKEARAIYNETKQGEMPNVDGKIQLIRKLNDDLFEGEKILSPGMMDGSVEKLMKLMQEGKSPDAIKQYISQNPRFFSRKYEMIYKMTADALGYENWDKTYTQIVKRLEEKAAKEGLTIFERKQLTQLENLNMQRAYMINGLGKKSEADIKKELLQYENAKMMKMADEVESIESFRMTDEGKRLSYTDNDRAVANRKVNDKEPEMRTVRTTNKDEDYEILEKIMSGLNKSGYEQLTKGEMEFFERTLDEVTPLLKTYFKRSYSDLSIPQKNMLVELAKKNQFLRSSGKPVIKEPSKELKRKAALTKVMAEESKRIDAIEKVIGVNSDVVFKQADGMARGTVSGVHIADDGRLTLDIATPDGTTIANVSSSEIQKVSEFRKDLTPDEIIEKSTVNEMAIAQAEDSIVALEKQRDELLGSATEKHSQLIANYEKQIQDLEARHAKEVEKLENKKGRNARTKVEIEHLRKVLDEKKTDLTKRIADANKEHGARNVKVKKDLLGEYKERAGKVRSNIRLYEELKQGYDNALKEGNFEHIDTLRHHMNQLDEILASDDALETFIRTQYKVMDEVAVAGDKTKKDADIMGKEIAQIQKENKQVADLIKQRDEVIRSMTKRINDMENGYTKETAKLDLNVKVKKRAELAQVLDKNHARISSLQGEVKQIMDGVDEYAQTIVMPKEHVVRAIDLRTDIPDTQKAWLEMLRGKMMEFAESEVAIGKLTQEQYERWQHAYLPHILTPEGEAFFKSKKNIDKHGNYLTQDMGYGMKTNPFAKGRTITKETTGKETDPTIAEINDYFRDALKGKNMFSENLSDIYVARALKNTELLYDNEYMDNMINVFGDVIGRNGVKEGYKAVMNVGKLKEMIYGEVYTLVRKSESEGIEVTEEMRKKWREDRLKYYKLDKGILDFEATPMVELTQEQLAKIGKVNPDNVRQVNDAIVHKANQARKLQIAKDRSKTLQMYDKFLHLVKINQTTVLPSFHVRNKLANLFNNWIEIGGDAVSKELHKDVYDALKHKGDPEKLTKRFNITKDGEVVGNMTMAEAYDLAKMHGVVDEGFFAADLGADAMVQGGVLKKVLPAKFNPLDTANNVLYKTGSKIGSFNENMDRTIHFVSQLRKGKSAEEASQSVNKVLFDYSDLTAFEQSVMKRLIPYYTFWKKNTKLQVTQVIENPEKYRLAAKGLNAVEGGVNEEDKVDRNYVDPFAQDWAQTVFNYTNDKGEKEPVLWSPNLPFGDFNRIPNPFNPEGTANSVISQLTPLLKEPLEQLTNHSHFFNNELFYKKENEEGEMVVDADYKDRLKHVGSNSGLFNLGEGIVNKDGMDLALHLLNYTTGLKYLSYDVEGKKRMEFVDKQEKEKVTDISGIADFEEKGNYIQTAMKMVANGVKAVGGGISEGLKDGIESLGIPHDELEEKADNVKWAVLDNAVMDATGLEEALSGKQFATGQITEVLDGDTVRAKLKNGKTIDVRVKLIDTPEISHYEGEEAMPYGNQAKEFAENKLLYQNARLIIEGKDVYGRSLAYIIANDEEYNKEALKEGMGKMTYLFDEYGNKDLKKYLKVQQEAYNNEKGLWEKEGYANPDKDADFKWKASKDKK